MNVSAAFDATPVGDVDLSRYVAVTPQTTVGETLEAMCTANRACACVVSEGRLAGIFTQRDVLMRVIGRPKLWDVPIVEEMTTSVRALEDTQTVSDGLAVMNDWWVRNVPIITGEGTFVGNLSWYVVMQQIAAVVTERIGSRVPREVDVRDGLRFIDFAGLNTTSAVIVGADDTADIAAHHMRARAIGSVMVVDKREKLIGVLTEFDLQTRVGCTQADLDTVRIGDIMTRDPVAVSARSSLADAIVQMAERSFSHVPLIGESGRVVAVASFRTIASYFEASLEALA